VSQRSGCATCSTTREALELARGKTRAELDTNRLLNLALVRLLEIVGEAATRMTPEDRALYPDISLVRDRRSAQSPDPRL